MTISEYLESELPDTISQIPFCIHGVEWCDESALCIACQSDYDYAQSISIDESIVWTL